MKTGINENGKLSQNETPAKSPVCMKTKVCEITGVYENGGK